MRGGSSPEVVRHLRTLFQFGVAGTFSDEQLLGRFLASRDQAAEEAFAELVRRHGPMVLGVCRRVLGDAHDAEDAFQATFLVLARKAASVVRREKVASWLHGVAVRTAREARVRSARRRAREERVSTPIHVEPPDDGFPAELREILDEELARLPARHRGPVVLCELEGLSRPEAARRLGIPEGTLSSRLSRAKARLRDRLSSRGVTLTAAAISALLVREARSATVPLSLLESTVQAATLVAAGPGSAAAAALSAPVVSLSEGVIKAMLVAKLKGIALVVGTLTAAVPVAVVVAQSSPKNQAAQAPPPAPAEGKLGPPKDEEPKPLRGPGPSEALAAATPQPEDRTAALEKKLDRVIEALQHLSKPDGPPPFATRGPEGPSLVPSPGQSNPPPSPDDATPTMLEPAPSPTTRVADNAPQLMNPPPTTVPQPPSVHRAPLSNRLENLEKQMQQVQQRLDLLERRLKALDARVGGGEVESILEPPPAGSSNPSHRSS